jgi:Domain of unknown function (DUF4919)
MTLRPSADRAGRRSGRRRQASILPGCLTFLLVVSCGWGTSTVAAQETPPVPEPPEAASPPAAPPSVDFAGLRALYGERRDFYEICEQDRPLETFFKLTGAQRWEELLAASQAWVEACPVDIDAHLFSGMALSKLGRVAESEEHRRWYRGLVESVLASGDGDSPETAYVVISVPEEYAVLRALGLRFQEQSLLEGGIDMMTVESESGTARIFFNPAAHFRRFRDRHQED